MPTSNTEELGRFLKCTVIGRGVFGPCACCMPEHPVRSDNYAVQILADSRLQQ